MSTSSLGTRGSTQRPGNRPSRAQAVDDETSIDGSTADREKLLEGISNDDLCAALEQARWARQQGAPLKQVPLDRTETRLKWIFPRLLRSVFPEWNPGRRDSPLNYMALGPLESVLDIELFKLALRHRCIGRIKQRAIGSWEHRGDKVLFPLVTEAIREAVEGPLSPFCLTWLGKKYSSNDTFACFGYAYSMLNRMSDCPLHVLNNPDIGDLAGGIELYFCIVFDSDMAYRGGSLLRIKKILRGMFNHRVLPHLALDVAYIRAYEQKTTYIDLPGPVPPMPQGAIWVFRRVEWDLPEEDAQSAELWDQMYRRHKDDWRVVGKFVEAKQYYSLDHIDIPTRQLVLCKKDDGTLVWSNPVIIRDRKALSWYEERHRPLDDRYDVPRAPDRTMPTLASSATSSQTPRRGPFNAGVRAESDGALATSDDERPRKHRKHRSVAPPPLLPVTQAGRNSTSRYPAGAVIIDLTGDSDEE